MEYTEYCPKSGKRHIDIRTGLNGVVHAIFCPSCGRSLTASEVIDLTDSSPQVTPSVPVRSTAMTIPTERSRPIPITYNNAHNTAVESQQKSIALTARSGPTTIELHAKFYIVSGVEDTVAGMAVPKYDRPPTGSFSYKSKIKVVMTATYPSHADMVTFLVSNFKASLATSEWKLIAKFDPHLNSYGPQYFNEVTYNTVRLKDFFDEANLQLPSRAEIPINLLFFYFDKRENSEENDTDRPPKRPIEQVESAEAEGSTSKRTTKPKQEKGIKKEKGIKREKEIKKEAIRPTKKEKGVEEEIKVETGQECIAKEEGNESDVESFTSAAFEAFLNSTEETNHVEEVEEEVVETNTRPKRSKGLPQRFKQ